MRSQYRLRATLTVVLLLLLAACAGEPSPAVTTQPIADGSSTSTPGTTQPDGTGSEDLPLLTIALASLEGEVFEPSRSGSRSKAYQSIMYDYLIGATYDGQLDNSMGVASDWSFSDDGLTWTLTIRDNITFWDGSPLTAEDVVFTFERLLEDGAVAATASVLQDLIDSVEATGDYEVTVELNRTDLFLPFYMSRLGQNDGAVISKAQFDRLGEDGFASQPMGSGPYALKDFRSGDFMEFERVENHWRIGTPIYEKIRLVQVPEEATRVGMLRQGEADIASISREIVDRVTSEGFTVASTGQATTVTFIFTEQWEESRPWYDPRIREAINLAINSQEIIDTLFLGQGQLVQFGFGGDQNVGYDPDTVDPYPYDPERARALLEEAGYLANPIPFLVFSYQSNDVPELAQISAAVQGYLQAVGFDVGILEGEYATVRADWGNQTVGNVLFAGQVGNRLVYPLDNIFGSQGGLRLVDDEELFGIVDHWKSSQTIEEAGDRYNDIVRHVHANHQTAPIAAVGNTFGMIAEIEPWPGLSDGKFPTEIHLEGLFAP